MTKSPKKSKAVKMPKVSLAKALKASQNKEKDQPKEIIIAKSQKLAAKRLIEFCKMTGIKVKFEEVDLDKAWRKAKAVIKKAQTLKVKDPKLPTSEEIGDAFHVMINQTNPAAISGMTPGFANDMPYRAEIYKMQWAVSKKLHGKGSRR